MSEEQRPVRQVFKEYKVFTASTAEQLGLSVTAMMSLGLGWQLYGPLMCVQVADNHVEYYQAMMLYEYVQDPLPGETSNANDTPAH